MGPYLALIILWVIGAWRGGELMRTALISEIVLCQAWLPEGY